MYLRHVQSYTQLEYSCQIFFLCNKNTKCPIDAHCHRHCRRDPSFPHYPTIYDLAFFDLNQPTEKLAEDLSSAAQDPVNLDELVARTIDPYSDENLEVPLKNPVPNPADDQVASAPVQYGFIMTQSDEPNNNEVPVTSPSLPAPVKRRGRKKDSLELKAIKAQIKNDEKQKAAQRIKELKKR